MKRIIITSAALLALLAPLAASAETFTNGTSTTTGTQSVTGTLTSQASDHTVTNGVEISLQGSLQLVKSISADGTSLKYNGIAEAGASTKQVDGSLSLNVSEFSDVATSSQKFSGIQTSSSATTSSSAFTSISPN